MASLSSRGTVSVTVRRWAGNLAEPALDPVCHLGDATEHHQLFGATQPSAPPTVADADDGQHEQHQDEQPPETGW